MGSIEEGFKRAWTSIFDSNMSSILTAFILVIIGTGFVKGFAVTLIVGILLSMFTAIIVSRTLLRFFAGEWMEKYPWILGISRKEIKNQ